MGFEPPKKTYRLLFVDADYSGAEVVCHSTTLGMLDSIDRSVAGMKLFGDEILVSWNVTKDGEELPANGEGMMATDGAFAIAVIEAWAKGMTGVSDPLESPLRNGKPPPAVSIPMVPLSESPPS